MAKKTKKRSPKKIAKAKAGSRTCHITKSGRRFVLKCPQVAPIKLAMGVLGVQFASKGVARAAKAAPSTGTVVANAAGDATTVSSSFTMPAAGVSASYLRGSGKLTKKQREAIEAARWN